MFQLKQCVHVTLLPENVPCSATVCHVAGKHLILAVNADDLTGFESGMPMLITYDDHSGIHSNPSTIISRRDNMVVTQLSRARVLQRRARNRYICDIPIYYHTSRSLPLSVFEKLDDTDLKAGWMHDISMGGAKLYTAVPMFNDTPLGIRACLGIYETMHLDALVIRCMQAELPVEIPDGLLCYTVAVRFQSLSRADKLTLHRFISDD